MGNNTESPPNVAMGMAGAKGPDVGNDNIGPKGNKVNDAAAALNPPPPPHPQIVNGVQGPPEQVIANGADGPNEAFIDNDAGGPDGPHIPDGAAIEAPTINQPGQYNDVAIEVAEIRKVELMLTCRSCCV